MLIDKNIIADIEKKLGTQHNEFNVQIFLQLLQITSRPLGYPAYKEGINDDYYLAKLKQRLEHAQSFNQRAAVTILDSLAQLRFCFCYWQYTLGYQQIDAELLSLLEQAIDNRLYTTAEEQCAEKSLLRMLITKPEEILLLCAEHKHRLQQPEIQQPIQTRIKLLKGIYEDGEVEEEHAPFVIKLFEDAIRAAQDRSIFNTLKSNHQQIVATYLSKQTPQSINDDLIICKMSDGPYLKSPIASSSESTGMAEHALADDSHERKVFFNY